MPPPPMELRGSVATPPMRMGRVANSANFVHASWATFEALATFRVDATQPGIDDWSVGFVQRILLIASFDCYRRLSGPALDPSSSPLDEGPVLVRRRTLARGGRYPLDHAEWRQVRWARPPVLGSSFEILASMSDSPGFDCRAFRSSTPPGEATVDTCIHSSSVHTQFFVTVGARHDPTNRFYPMWHIRWDLRARYFHFRHLHADFESRRDERVYDFGIVSSSPSAHDMGAHGYVLGPDPSEVPANRAQAETEEWMASCPEL